MCVADNAYMIEWKVNGSVVRSGYSTHQGTAYSVLSLAVTYDTEVVCVVGSLRRNEYFKSQPAMISVVHVCK